jgi:chromatin segregation and condensation protein Rec8/ScpA/Scc1 (kleisin family)
LQNIKAESVCKGKIKFREWYSVYSYLSTMKNRIDIPVPRAEDTEAANKRRENYALTRDVQALEQNEAIAKRLKTKAKNKITCIKCNREFSPGADAKDSLICPDCI